MVAIMTQFELWTDARFKAVLAEIKGMRPVEREQYLRDLALSIVSLAASTGAIDWPADLSLVEVIGRHIPHGPTPVTSLCASFLRIFPSAENGPAHVVLGDWNLEDDSIHGAISQ